MWLSAKTCDARNLFISFVSCDAGLSVGFGCSLYGIGALNVISSRKRKKLDEIE